MKICFTNGERMKFDERVKVFCVVAKCEVGE